MSTPDENAAKTDTQPLLDAAEEAAEEERGGEPRPAGQAAMEEALKESGRTAEDLTAPDTEDGDSAG
ncbi:hypothetical protein E1267_18755 [Nonomuraea longispora]|uniref:Uncharacterized protein n=1 Tax=Nonomuraea longispora TaxID=1848320 RepID=A0A4R4NBW9_9ACTN|nr:hypothetical protein [Nonomuraea longispora]TDC05744.1 hypothetical protein E1267_18755 [Nonomuraea longispora]